MLGTAQYTNHLGAAIAAYEGHRQGCLRNDLNHGD
jgi:hypothetical protein